MLSKLIMPTSIEDFMPHDNQPFSMSDWMSIFNSTVYLYVFNCDNGFFLELVSCLSCLIDCLLFRPIWDIHLEKA